MNKNNLSAPVSGSYAHLLLMLASTCLMTACQKAETVTTTAERLKSVEQKQQEQPDVYVPRKSVDYMSDLKSLKENAPKTAVAPPTPAAAPAEVRAPIIESKPAAPAPVAAAVQTAPPPSAPAANVVASAAPTARPAPPKDVASTVTVVSREPPDFPRDAMRAGIESGSVRAKLIITAAGTVSSVVIVEAKPTRVFDRAVTQALLRWKFNPGTDGRTYETEVNFKL